MKNDFEKIDFYPGSKQEKTQEEKEKEEYLENYLEAVGLDWEDLEGKQVLDIGAGLGEFAEKAKEKHINVISLEAKPELWEDEGMPSKETPYIQGDANQLPFQNNSFDLVISRAAPPILASSKEEVKNIIEEAERVLKEEGEFRFGPGPIDAGIFPEEELNEEAGGDFQELGTEQRMEMIKKKALYFLQSLNFNIKYKEKEDPETGGISGFYILRKEADKDHPEFKES
jgi:SAM-dependent methyltransferase